MLKNIIAGASLVCMVTSLPLHANESCTFRRSLPYYPDTDFRANIIMHVPQSHPQHDTNATLFRRGEKGNLINELAKSYKIDAERNTLIVYLDQTCKWSDGQAITAAQLKRGIELTFQSDVDVYLPGRPMIANGQDILLGKKGLDALGVRVVDDYTIEFDLIVDPSLLLAGLTHPSFTPAPLHLMERNPTAWPTPTLIRESSGAFTAKSLNDVKITLERNPHYCQNIPVSPQKVEYIRVTPKNNNLEMFFDGLIDVAHYSSFKSQNFEVMRRKGNVDFNIVNRYEEIVGSLNLSHTAKWARNPDVRHAIALVIDYDAVSRIVSPEKEQVEKHHQLSTNYDGYEVFPVPIAMSDYPLRVEEAKQLMEKAGYNAQNRLNIKFLFRGGYPSTPLMHAFIAMLNQIYIDVDIDSILEGDRNFYTEIFGGRFDLAITKWGSDYPDPSNFLSGVLTENYFPKEAIPDLKVALEDSYHIIDKKERYEKLAEIERGILSLHYMIPLFDLKTTWLLAPGYTLGSEFVLTGKNAFIDGCPG